MLIKICGLRRKEDILYANELNPDFIGFVFAESKRKIDIKEAIELKKLLKPSIKAVGVFRNNDINLVKYAINNNVIDIIQLHGDEDDEYIKEIKKITDKKIILAYRNSNYADYILYDNLDPGSGKEADWNKIDINKPFFLAGGININNVDKALKLNPYAIDTSSGVETNGYKDYDKMKEIIRRIRDYAI